MTTVLFIMCAAQAAAIGQLWHRKSQLELRERLRAFGACVD